MQKDDVGLIKVALLYSLRRDNAVVVNKLTIVGGDDDVDVDVDVNDEVDKKEEEKEERKKSCSGNF